MSKRAVVVVLAVAFCMVSACGLSYAAEAKQAAPAQPAAAKTAGMPARPSNIGLFGGTIENIDTSDPANVKIRIKDEATGTSRTVSVAQWTNITKVTDISELKTGEAVRVMARKVGDKDVAMGIIFGKIKNLPPLRSRPATAQAAEAQAKPAAKK